MAVEPLAITAKMLKAHLTGLSDLIEAQASESGLSASAIAAQYILAAQGAICDEIRLPFFQTRYCTPTMASQESYTLGTDFDRYVEPSTYNVTQWRTRTGRTRLPHGFILPDPATILLRLSLAGSNKIADIPAAWINRGHRTGVLHIVPWGSSAVQYSAYYTLVGVLVMQGQSAVVGAMPLSVHYWYTAGMCARTYVDGATTKTFDPESTAAIAACCTTEDAGLVRRYQQCIGLAAAADLCQDVARGMDEGGYTAAFDGMSLGVNSQALYQHAQTLTQSLTEKKAMLAGIRPPGMAWA